MKHPWSYLDQVRIAASLSGWNDVETASHLALALQGTPQQALMDLTGEQQDIPALTAVLERRFGKRQRTGRSQTQQT